MENNIKITGSVKVNGASFKGAVNVGNNIDGCVAERGVAGFSPIANVVTNGDDVTITITDYKGTTTATIPDMADEVERIEALIPNTASPTNKLVDTATLDSSVQTATSNFRGDWDTYADIPTDVSLYPVDAAGIRTPSTNDYLVVVADEEQNGGTWRYKYVGLWSVDGKNGWQAEYQVNETPFTADQLAAINSGITSELVEEIGQGGGGLDNKITNCLLEVPQNIKLELNNGTLTLKAGSKVIVPNGFEADGTTPKFDYVIMYEDLSLSTTQTNTYQEFLFINPNKQFEAIPITYCTSGSTEPTSFFGTYAVWYDTGNNKLKLTSNSGSTWVEGISFPLSTFTVSTTQIESIDQVFNGIGYIGSTVWVDKEVKGLIPNGRNEDGSLRNIEFTTDSLLSFSEFNNNTSNYAVIDYNGGNLSLARSTVSVTDYDFSNNFIKREDGLFRNSVIVAVVNCSLTGITNFQSKLPFRAVDYSDKSTVSGYAMPSNRYIDLTLGASGARYTAPANGWYILQTTSNSSIGNIAINGGDGQANSVMASTGGVLYASIAVRKGTSAYVTYYDIITNYIFRFIYADGEV